MKDNSEDLQQLKQVSDHNGHNPQVSSAKTFLPGGYDPRHREPSYCNADRASWWELMVLASHVHPSVATMAGTLLSGTNIIYNGNPLNDLSLTAFLGKFMEKKPKASTWHGGSQIEPAKKLDMSNQLIGQAILSLAEADVPPEDLVFHKFYVNKMNSSKKSKKKKKKKLTEDEAAEELFGVDGGDDVDGGDESDNEEIEKILDYADPSLEAERDYDYDDLDQVANEEDDDLVGNVSDGEIDIASDYAEGEDFDAAINDDNTDDDDLDPVDVNDVSDDEDESNKRKRKQKKTGASPFASLEDYEQLINEDSSRKQSTGKGKPGTVKKKKNRSSE